MQLQGIYTPIVTPFADDGSIDEATLERVVERQLENGIHGIIPCGSTGEAYALDPAERRRVLEVVRETVGDRAELIAGTNDTTTRAVIAHSQVARELGYQGVMLAPPYYVLPTQAELVVHFRAVVDAVGLPIVLYNFPARAGVELGIEALDGLRDVPEIVGIKESSGQIARMFQLKLRYGSDIQLVCGADDQALDYYLWGVTAWIAGSANVLPREHVLVHEAAMRGDIEGARALFEPLMPLFENLEGGNYIQKAKLGTGLAGLAVGTTRAPLLALDADQAAAFTALYDAAAAATPTPAPGD